MLEKIGEMAEPLDTIIAALVGRDYRVSGHMWENYVLENDRPDPDIVIRAIIEDEPRVTSHDRNNPRGSSCDIDLVDINTRPIRVTIGYGSRPITIVTAYYLDSDLEAVQGASGGEAPEEDSDPNGR